MYTGQPQIANSADRPRRRIGQLNALSIICDLFTGQREVEIRESEPGDAEVVVRGDELVEFARDNIIFPACELFRSRRCGCNRPGRG